MVILLFCKTWDMRFKMIKVCGAGLVFASCNQQKFVASFSMLQLAEASTKACAKHRTTKILCNLLSHLDSSLDIPLHYSYILHDGGKKQKSNRPKSIKNKTIKTYISTPWSVVTNPTWMFAFFCRRGDSLQLQPQAFESGRLCAIVCADLKVMCKNYISRNRVL